MRAVQQRPELSWNSFIGELLSEQESLTAVERFSRDHARSLEPDQAKYYRNLLPTTAPASGEQYGFEVDLDKCSGCKACVTACHSLNGLEEKESWRSVGLLIQDGPSPAHHTVTTACHHCVDPGCLNGCPVLAYEKDPVTGIVRHLDDQCIGCQYCVMKCPYEVPKYSARLGIVRKCDMCSGRLATGEAPACVQACPNEAIRIVLVDQESIAQQFRNRGVASDPTNFLADTPPPHLTLPTTRFKTESPLLSSARAGDAFVARPADPHTPLVIMLVFSQLAVGAQLLVSLTNTNSNLGSQTAILSVLAPLSLMLGMVAGTCHLGRPRHAWKAFLGWRRSWLSRELILFGTLLPMMALQALALWGAVPSLSRSAIGAWSGVTSLLAFAALGSSIMIYADTGRPFWSLRRTAFQFVGTTLLLGAAVGLAVIPEASHLITTALALVLVLGSLAKLAFESSLLSHWERTPRTPLSKTAQLLVRDLSPWTRLRMALLVAGGIVLPSLVIAGTVSSSTALAMTAGGLCLGAELVERVLFFRAVVPFKMPGGVTP